MNIINGDITGFNPSVHPSAIVNAANRYLLGGGGVDGAIHRAAGPSLKMECLKLPAEDDGIRCPTGEARITPAGKLGVDFVIHTVGPVWPATQTPDVSYLEAYRQLECSLRSCFEIAIQNGIKSIALPAISCGVYGGSIHTFASILEQEIAYFEGHDLPEITVFLYHPQEYAEFLVADHFVKTQR